MFTKLVPHQTKPTQPSLKEPTRRVGPSLMDTKRRVWVGMNVMWRLWRDPTVAEWRAETSAMDSTWPEGTRTMKQ
jgi:hypothetical protein